MKMDMWDRLTCGFPILTSYSERVCCVDFLDDG